MWIIGHDPFGVVIPTTPNNIAVNLSNVDSIYLEFESYDDVEVWCVKCFVDIPEPAKDDENRDITIAEFSTSKAAEEYLIDLVAKLNAEKK